MQGIDEQEFKANLDIREIVCFNIFQIGELAKNLPDELLGKYNKVPWKDIKGMRDWVAHGYGSLDLVKTWNTATKDIKILKDYCEKILKDNN